jgi:tight adherence protein C
MLLIAVLLFIAITVSITAFGYFHYVKPARMLDQLASSTSDTISSPASERQGQSELSLAELLAPIGNLLPISPQDTAITKGDLVSAGFRSAQAVAVYYGCKVLLAAVLVLLSLTVRGHVENPLFHAFLPVICGGLGYCLPAFVLGRLVKRRHQQIRLALPDVLDLLVICTEAGCGLDQAIVNVSRELKQVHPAVSEELSFVNMEIMAGKSRADALRNFGKRTGEEEVQKLVAILIQTDRFGTSVAEALRTQSEFLRMRRRQEAEERAGKVGVKLVFPIFFFCLPTLIVVTAGPGFLQVFRNLGALAH